MSEEEKTICRDRASRERNEFSAKQTYNYCSKNIKSELKKEKRDAKEWQKKYDHWYEEVGKKLESECNKKEKRFKEIGKLRTKGIPTTIKEDIEGLDYVICRNEIGISKEKYGL